MPVSSLSSLIAKMPADLLSRLLYLYSAGVRREFFMRPEKVSSLRPKRLLVDVSHQVYRQVRGGIPRVVNATAKALLELNQADFSFEFCMLLNGKLYTARRFTERKLALQKGSLGVDQPISIRPGDHFLVLDCVMDKYAQFLPYFDQIHRLGGSVNTVINDILVIDHPEWFPDDFAAAYRAALPLVVENNQRLFCVSRTTAEAVMDWICVHKPQRLNEVQLLTFEQGAEINPAADGQLIRPQLSDFLKNCRKKNLPVFALISTIEPRKGQDFALDVFEKLWAENAECALLFMGRTGWKAEALVERIRACAESGRRFLFVESASDAELDAVFANAHALFSPSLDEGYGLPLIEAALHGVPVVVSDIPIYHEVAGAGGTFFVQGDVKSCCQVIQEACGWSAEQRKTLAAEVQVGSWEKGAQDIINSINKS